MSLDLEYAIKTDVRNNPVIREVDTRQRHDLWRLVLLVTLTVGTTLLVSWQHMMTKNARVRIEHLRIERAEAESQNRRLRLNLESETAPSRIEERARALGMRPATLAETLVLEPAEEPALSGGMLASAR
jgi:cell division protein FtsL